MIWDINAIHTAYPDFLSAKVREAIYNDENPFVSDIFSRVGSFQERRKVIEGGPLRCFSNFRYVGWRCIC